MARLEGTNLCASHRQDSDTTWRSGPARPSRLPRRPYRLPAARSYWPERTGATSRGTTSGGCCRSASITAITRPLALVKPSFTAPPRPPSRCPGPRWMSVTLRLPLLARPSTTSGVESSESSTNSNSHSPLRSARAASRRRASGSILPASLRVGITIDRTGRSPSGTVSGTVPQSTRGCGGRLDARRSRTVGRASR